jgi:hypothetical protein
MYQFVLDTSFSLDANYVSGVFHSIVVPRKLFLEVVCSDYSYSAFMCEWKLG